MKLKKYQHKDLNLKRGFYFIVVLFSLLVLLYIILEWKTEVDNKGYDLGVHGNKEVITKDSTVILETKVKH